MGAVTAISRAITRSPGVQKAAAQAAPAAKVVDAYNRRKEKRRGRSATIMSSSVGVEEKDVTLCKKSLLG